MHTPRRIRAGSALVLILGLVMTACTGAPGPSTGPTQAPAQTAAADPTPAITASSTAPTLAPGVLEKIELGHRPSGILAAGGYVWTEDHARTQTVYAMDPVTGKIAGEVFLTRPCDFVEADGLLWVADLDASKLVAIDMKTFKKVREVANIPGPCGPAFAGGWIWMVVSVGLGRVDPVDGSLEVIELDSGGAFPGQGLPLWAGTYGTGELHRIDLKSGRSELDIPPPGGKTERISIATGFDSLWVGNESLRHVYRLDPQTGEILAEVPVASPSRLLVTSDSVWMTSYVGGMVQRIDPETNTVVYEAQLGGNINGITEGFGSIWVADTLGGFLYRIDPGAMGIGT